MNNQVVGYTLPFTDLDALATSTFEAKLPEIMARAVSRRVIKKGAIYLAKDQMQAAPLASLGMDAVGSRGKRQSLPIRGVGVCCRERSKCCAWNYLPGCIA